MKFKKVLWFFLIGSLFGFLMETILSYFQFGSFQSRKGLIYGPLSPIYGFGAILFLVLVKDKPSKVFFKGMFLGCVFEYICSYVQEICFGTSSWNYSNQMFNINGRTSLFLGACWGIIAVLFVFIIYPYTSKIIDKIPNQFTFILSLLLIFDLNISFFACIRQNERYLNVEASNKIDVFLDDHYPDERLNKIFVNAKRRK